MTDERFVEAPDHAHWAQAEEATALGDQVTRAPEEAWLSRLRDSTLLVLAVVAHAHEITLREVRRAVGWDAFPGALRLSLRKLERLGLVEREKRPGPDYWLATPEGARLGVIPYVARLLDAARPRFHGVPSLGWSAARFRKVGTTGGPPIFSPAWTLAHVTDPKVLADAIRSGAPDDRAYALTKLVALRDPASVDVLREVVEHAHGNDELYARKGVVALGNFDTPASVATLIDIASDRDSIMRESAVRALGRLRAPSAIPILVDLIAYPSEPVRAAALTALGRIGDPTSATAIAAALDDPDMVVRHCARQALIKLGATDALKHNPCRLLPLRALDTSRAQATKARQHGD